MSTDGAKAVDAAGRVLNDCLWSDPTDHDEHEGVMPNPRGPNTVKFGPDRVQVRVRIHLCVHTRTCAPARVHAHARAQHGRQAGPAHVQRRLLPA